MTDHAYTDDDLRAEAARQHAALTEDPDFMGVGEQMEDAAVDHTDDGDTSLTWTELLVPQGAGASYEAFGEAQRKIHGLINGAADVSQWAVDLGAAGLTATTSMGWYVTTSGWDIALQIAHRSDVRTDVRDEIESAVRLAVERVLSEHGLAPRGLDTTT